MCGGITSAEGSAGAATGGAAVVLARWTAPTASPGPVTGLRPNGQVIVLEGRQPIQVTGHVLMTDRLTPSG
jgi:hypothetical protein